MSLFSKFLSRGLGRSVSGRPRRGIAKEITDVIQRHEDDDNASNQIDGLDAQPSGRVPNHRRESRDGGRPRFLRYGLVHFDQPAKNVLCAPRAGSNGLSRARLMAS